WPLALLGLSQAVDRRVRLAYGAAVLLLLATFVLTYSRAGWMVLALQLAALGLILLLARLRRTASPSAQALPRWLGGGLGLLLLGLLALPSVREVLARVADFGGYSMTGRV